MCVVAMKQLYDDVIKHFPRYWPFVWGIHGSPVNSPHKGQWRGALMFSLISAWINGWVNNREAGDLRRHHAHYEVTVMSNSDHSGKYKMKIRFKLMNKLITCKQHEHTCVSEISKRVCAVEMFRLNQNIQGVPGSFLCVYMLVNSKSVSRRKAKYFIVNTLYSNNTMKPITPGLRGLSLRSAYNHHLSRV